MSGPSRKQQRAATRNRNVRRRSALAQRTESVRRGKAAEGSGPPGVHRRNLAIVVVAVLVVGAAIFVYARSIGGSPSPSQELEATPTADTSNGLFPFDPPDAYTVTYRHVAYDGSDATTTTQQYSVTRPFEARVVSLNGEPPGGGEQWSVTTTLGLYEQSTADDGATTQVAAPATGLGDYRLDASIDDLVTDGTFVRRVLRTLLGRQCQVYRTGSPAEAYTITAPTAENFVDLCIDHSGIVLEELAVASGAVSEHLVATAIDITPTLTDADFPITTAPSGSGTLNEIARDTSPVPGYWAMSTVPDGYQLQHRYRLTQAVADPSSTAGTTGGSATANTIDVDSYVDVYVNGTNTIIVHQGPTSAEPSTETSGADVTSTALGTVHIASGVRGTAASAHPTAPAGWFVHVTGTVPRADLQSAVNSMTSS